MTALSSHGIVHYTKQNLQEEARHIAKERGKKLSHWAIVVHREGTTLRVYLVSDSERGNEFINHAL
jgi:hypothetical protein